MAINIRKDGSLFIDQVVTAYDALVDGALTSQVHRDKTAKQTGTSFIPASTAITISAVTPLTQDGYDTSVNFMRGLLYQHMLDTSAHLIADTTNINFDGYTEASDLATSIALANAIKVDYTAHMTQSGVHLNNDVTNAITAPDATIFSELGTLLIDMRTKLNAHIASAGLVQRFVIVPD